MPIWGERRITWRQIVPAVVIPAALVCLGLTIYQSLRPERGIDKSVRLRILIDQLNNPDPAMVSVGIRELGELGEPEAVASIRPKLQAEEPRVVGAACAALGKLGDSESAAAILKLLEHDDPRVVAGAAEGLGALRHAKALEPLVDTLQTTDAQVRLAAIVALGQFGDPAAAKALSDLKADPCAGLDPAPTDAQRAQIGEALQRALARPGAAE